MFSVQLPEKRKLKKLYTLIPQKWTVKLCLFRTMILLHPHCTGASSSRKTEYNNNIIYLEENKKQTQKEQQQKKSS